MTPRLVSISLSSQAVFLIGLINIGSERVTGSFEWPVVVAGPVEDRGITTPRRSRHGSCAHAGMRIEVSSPSDLRTYHFLRRSWANNKKGIG